MSSKIRLGLLQKREVPFCFSFIPGNGMEIRNLVVADDPFLNRKAKKHPIEIRSRICIVFG